MLVSPTTFAEVAQNAGRSAGFDLCGVVTYPFPEVEGFSDWIAQERHGEMDYLARRNDSGELRRQRLEAAIPWARSVVVCAINYNPDAPYSTECTDPSRAWISRYALSGNDYHDVLLPKLLEVEDHLHLKLGEFTSRCYVDTGPIVERALAQAAGIGWIGKNTCLINERERLGSWLYLGVIVTDLEISTALATLPAPDRCGTCTRCIDACPTDALVAPYQMDARRCIAYLTIEKRGSIDDNLRSKIGNNVFGCDICQDVCPWNRRDADRAPIAGDPSFRTPDCTIAPALETLLAMSMEEWRATFRGSPVKRAKYQGFMRNVCIAAGNSFDPRFLPRLSELAHDDDRIIAEHAQWAVERIELHALSSSKS